MTSISSRSEKNLGSIFGESKASFEFNVTSPVDLGLNKQTWQPRPMYGAGYCLELPIGSQVETAKQEFMQVRNPNLINSSID